ncbi:hypothetical protein [Limnohabitans sp. Rim8]|jgi:hypothetical protein|uniref:hypothetical protein n=1 Tax=Limnohabitans sp. Rim8 TaxID=1100718 RepID=UPI0011B27751|nr:hypothetical protein [Limnohabitans sp. Rim8]
MSKIYFNSIKVGGNENACLAHYLTIKRLCLNNKNNPREFQEFNHPGLLNAFIPNFSSLHSKLDSGLLGCDIAYVDDRLVPGNFLKILSKGGAPEGVQEIYLKHLVNYDPRVVVSMHTYTCHPNEEWISGLHVQNGVICRI